MEGTAGNKTVMIVAGEASGDLHGAQLVRAMRKLDPAVNFYGIGGKKLREAGVELLADASEMAVVGLTEVFFKLRRIAAIMTMMKKSFRERKPALVILIDYPDFNLVLAEAAKKEGVSVLYYISPQVWAWRRRRVHKIKKLVDRMAVILPFEEAFYGQWGMAVDYVGHPLLDVLPLHLSKEEARSSLGLDVEKITVGLLPGSRVSEVRRLLPALLSAAGILKKERPALQFVLPLADFLEETEIRKEIAGSSLDVHVISGRTYEAMACCDLALVASGTATLELALLRVPMVIVYKVSFLSYLVGRIFVHLKSIGLVNIIAGEPLVPELIQGDVKGPRIAREALALLENAQRKQTLIRSFETIREKLGQAGAADRTAQLAMAMISGRTGP